MNGDIVGYVIATCLFGVPVAVTVVGFWIIGMKLLVVSLWDAFKDI